MTRVYFNGSSSCLGHFGSALMRVSWLDWILWRLCSLKQVLSWTESIMNVFHPFTIRWQS